MDHEIISNSILKSRRMCLKHFLVEGFHSDEMHISLLLLFVVVLQNKIRYSNQSNHWPKQQIKSRMIIACLSCRSSQIKPFSNATHNRTFTFYNRYFWMHSSHYRFVCAFLFAIAKLNHCYGPKWVYITKWCE